MALPDHQEIDLWDVATGKVRATLSEHQGEVRFLAYSGDGKTLIAASTLYQGRSFKWLGDLKLWDVATAKERIGFKGPFGRITEAALSADGKTLALLDAPQLHAEAELKLLEVVSGRQTILAHPPGHSFISLAFAADNKLLVVGTDDGKTLKLWEVKLPQAAGG
jgi:WD40 repeat protein